MSQDVVADALNEIMNIKRAGKNELEVDRYSGFLVDVLKVAKNRGYIDYSLDEKNKKLKIKIIRLNKCLAIKPRFNVSIDKLERYIRRFLPARGFGIIIISTSAGLLTQEEAYEKNIGGSLIAYFY
ncbi:MAG: 30S ribosomal protein S8 [Nanoarchaeota archaeon]